jgi:hypothetical protein
VAGACGYGEEHSGSENAGNFLTSCRTSYLLKDSAPWSKYVNECVCVIGLGFVCIKLCTDYVQVTGNHLSPMHFCVQANRDLWFRMKKLNTELRICKLLHDGLSGYL